jgi:hypothetical protein
MCDAVPITPIEAAAAVDRCGQMLPLIGNARPRSAARAGCSYHDSVIDRCGECLSAGNPTLCAWHGNCSSCIGYTTHESPI